MTARWTLIAADDSVVDRYDTGQEACDALLEHVGEGYAIVYIPEPPRPPTTIELLTEALAAINGLAEQQAMADDWYLGTTAKLSTAIDRLTAAHITGHGTADALRETAGTVLDVGRKWRRGEITNLGPWFTRLHDDLLNQAARLEEFHGE